VPLTSYIAALVIAAVIVSAVAFSYASSQLRYIFLEQLAYKVQRTQESVSAGAIARGTSFLVELKNNGATGVYVKSMKVAVTYKVEYDLGGGRTYTFQDLYSFLVQDFVLRPYQKRYFFLDLRGVVSLPPISAPVRAWYITYVGVAVATERGAYTFAPAPPIDAAAFSVDRSDIGKGFTVTLPGGEKLVFVPYEYIYCSVGPATRNSGPTVLDAAKLVVWDGSRSQEGFYSYGYDPSRRAVTAPDIRIWAEQGSDGLYTVCSVDSRGYSMSGLVVTLSRGIALLSTQIASGEVTVYTYAVDKQPELVAHGSTCTSGARSQFFVDKVAMPDRDISIYDFFSPQLAPYLSGSGKSAGLGSYYSQAVVVGQSLTVSAYGTNCIVKAKFYDPYPLVVVIEPPMPRGY